MVSVVLPTRDRPWRLGVALKSVLVQTYDQFEVLVIDDGSNPPIGDVVDQATQGDTRVTLRRIDVSGGAAAARNLAVSMAVGELVAFIDDDDEWMPEKLERQVGYLGDHPETGLVSCDALLVREGHQRHPEHFRRPGRLSAELLRWINCLGGFSSVMARRSVLGDLLTLDESFPSVEDWDLWLRCANSAPVGAVSEVLVRHIAHGEGRLSDVDSNRAGLEAFLAKHEEAMSPSCRAFHVAHQRMEQGHGWAKRAHVARALATGSPRASAMLAIEQVARQWGRLRSDPGLPDRVLARVIESIATLSRQPL